MASSNPTRRRPASLSLSISAPNSISPLAARSPPLEASHPTGKKQRKQPSSSTTLSTSTSSRSSSKIPLPSSSTSVIISASSASSSSISSLRPRSSSRTRQKRKSPTPPSTVSIQQRSVSSSSCPGLPASGRAILTGPRTTDVSAEGEVAVIAGKRADEVLGRLTGRDYEQESEWLAQHAPYAYDPTLPMSIPQSTSSTSLPSPTPSPSYQSPLLRPTMMGRTVSAPGVHVPLSRSFDHLDTDLLLLSPSGNMEEVDELERDPRDRSASPTNSIHSFLSISISTTRGAEGGEVEARETRRGSVNYSSPRRPSSPTSRSSSRQPSSSRKLQITTDSRPQLHTYTSFETAFDLRPPPSPPPSPPAQKESRGWWGRSTAT